MEKASKKIPYPLPDKTFCIFAILTLSACEFYFFPYLLWVIVYNCLYNKYDKCKLVKFVNNAHCCKTAKQRFCIASRQLRNKKKSLDIRTS